MKPTYFDHYNRKASTTESGVYHTMNGNGTNLSQTAGQSMGAGSQPNRPQGAAGPQQRPQQDPRQQQAHLAQQVWNQSTDF